MTRENAILCLKGIKNYGRDTFTEQSDWQESLDMAIKALEQEPCEDAVSRNLMTNTLGATCIAKRDEKGDLVALCSIDHLPSVTPKPRTGGWIEHFDESGKWYECDQCHTDWGGPVNYCPNCGAKMEGDKR